MKKNISIFLASSEELYNDRIAFGDFIRSLNDIYQRRNISIRLMKWEDFDSSVNTSTQGNKTHRKQDEYNQKIGKADIFLALFQTKAGKFTVEEFNYAIKLIKNLSDVLVQLFVLICSIYYFTRDGDKVMEYIFAFIPEKHKPFFEKTLEDVANVLKSIFYGHFLTAIIIGIMGGVGYYFLGYKFALFLGIITGIAQLIPIFGPWIVYWVLAIYALFVVGDITQGILTILWGFVLSLSDMYIRPMLASNYADMPSLILLVGFMAGPYVFGIVGFILGPLILGIAYAVIKSFKEELDNDKLDSEESEKE